MLNKQRDKLILLSAVFVITLLVGSLFIDRLISDKKKYYLAVQSELLDVKYKSVYKYLKIMSSDIHLMYSQNERLIKALKKAKHGDTQEKEIQRAYIYKILKRNYKRLQHMGISQVHFHTTDNKSFLRMFNPSVYGDDLGKIRPSIVQSNLTLKEQHGFEACKYMVGLRFVYPEHPGALVRGVATAHSAPPLNKIIVSEEPYVWPYGLGNVRGQAITPLHAKVPEAAMKDETFYILMALVDVLRVGRVREKELAIQELKQRIA